MLSLFRQILILRKVFESGMDKREGAKERFAF